MWSVIYYLTSSGRLGASDATLWVLVTAAAEGTKWLHAWWASQITDAGIGREL